MEMFSITGGFYYWLWAGPAGFLAISYLYRRQAVKSGVGAGRNFYVMAGYSFPAVVVMAAVVPIFGLLVFPLLMFPLTTISAILLVMGVLQRAKYLAWCSALFGILATLAQLGTFNSLLYRVVDGLGLFQNHYVDGANIIVYGLLGLLLIGMGLVARGIETTRE
jgi:hypothetical protein